MHITRRALLTQQTITVHVIEEKRLMARHDLHSALPRRLASCPKLRSLATEVAIEEKTVEHKIVEQIVEQKVVEEKTVIDLTSPVSTSVVLAPVVSPATTTTTEMP
jgi:hypothetical protein